MSVYEDTLYLCVNIPYTEIPPQCRIDMEFSWVFDDYELFMFEFFCKILFFLHLWLTENRRAGEAAGKEPPDAA